MWSILNNPATDFKYQSLPTSEEKAYSITTTANAADQDLG